jgi:hypothetical protein
MTGHLVIGRQGDIVLDATSVSRKHASIYVSKNGIQQLLDLEEEISSFIIDGQPH